MPVSLHIWRAGVERFVPFFHCSQNAWSQNRTNISSRNLERDYMIIVFFILLTDLKYCHSFLLAGILMVISVASNSIKIHLSDGKFAFCCHIACQILFL